MGGMDTVYLKTLGCKVNTFDTNTLRAQFEAAGYAVVEDPQDATVTVINSCSVTANAEKEARYLARRYRRRNANTTMVVTGCYAQTDSARLASLNEIDLVVPNEVKEQLMSTLERKRRGEMVEKIPAGVKAVENNRQGHFKSSLTLFDRTASTQTRSFVKIQDGCNGFCTYCIIPYARGASRSVPGDKAFNEIKRLVEEGSQEIVLTGIHLGDYDGAGDLADFISNLLEHLPIKRLRLSSLEPGEISDKLLSVLQRYRAQICEHFHLPLQSGSDAILRPMRRAYTTSEYRTVVEKLRAIFPRAAIGADVIPGFPGETEEQFGETVEFIRSLKLTYLHVFPYSRRPHTAADRMPGHLDAAVIAGRAAMLRKLSQELQASYEETFFGDTLTVLLEKNQDTAGRPIGYSRNYLQVSVSHLHGASLPQQEVAVQIRGRTPQGQLLGVAATV